MNIAKFLPTFTCVLLLASLLPAQEAAKKKPRPKRRPNPAFAAVKDDPKLPRVLLIGDSISIGYTANVRQRLKGKANVHRIPTNGGPTIRGLDNIGRWLGKSKWDVIHFNWGLHDLKKMDGKHQVPLDAYRKNLDKLVGRLEHTGAKLIWCSTTPVPAGKLSPPRSDADVIAYNQAAAEIMKSRRVAVNDLYGFALPRLKEIQRPSNVHFTAEGSKSLGEKVTGSILESLE